MKNSTATTIFIPQNPKTKIYLSYKITNNLSSPLPISYTDRKLSDTQEDPKMDLDNDAIENYEEQADENAEYNKINDETNDEEFYNKNNSIYSPRS